MNILKVKNLSLKVGCQELLKSVSFEIKRGEIFALVVESGSGKSLTSLSNFRV